VIFFTDKTFFVKKSKKSIQMKHENTWKLAKLPPKENLESRKILKRLPKAHAALKYKRTIVL
jgi:hypothetical protein